jgi:hypothetical protein
MNKLEHEILKTESDSSLQHIKNGFLLNRSPESFSLELIKDLPLESLPKQVKGFSELYISQYSLYRIILAGKLVEIIPVINISISE